MNVSISELLDQLAGEVLDLQNEIDEGEWNNLTFRQRDSLKEILEDLSEILLVAAGGIEDNLQLAETIISDAAFLARIQRIRGEHETNREDSIS